MGHVASVLHWLIGCVGDVGAVDMCDAGVLGDAGVDKICEWLVQTHSLSVHPHRDPMGPSYSDNYACAC